MKFKQPIRSVTGGLAVVTLLVLVAADTLYPEITLSLEDKLLLASMASTLLGADFLLSQGPLNISIWQGSDDE